MADYEAELLEAELRDLREKHQAAVHMMHQNELTINRYEDIIANALRPQVLVVDNCTCTTSDFSMMMAGASTGQNIASAAAYGTGSKPVDHSQLPISSPEKGGRTLYSYGQDLASVDAMHSPARHLVLNQLEAELRRQERIRDEDEKIYLASVDSLTAEAGRLVKLMRAVAADSKANLQQLRRRAQGQA